MKKTFIPVMLAALVMTGCAHTQQVVRDKQIRVAEAQSGVVTEPMVLEIGSVTEKPVTYTKVFSFTQYYDESRLNKALTGFKQAALEEFVFKSDYDMIVNVSFLTHTRNEGQKLVVEVKGYGVKYKQLRKATPEDAWMTNFNGAK